MISAFLYALCKFFCVTQQSNMHEHDWLKFNHKARHIVKADIDIFYTAPG